MKIVERAGPEQCVSVWWKSLRWTACAVLVSACQSEHQSAAAPPAQHQVAVVVLSPQTVAITSELPGRVSARLISEVRPQVNGIIKSRHFIEGSEVSPGDLLYEIDPAPYQAALDGAVAAKSKADAALANARVRLERYRELYQRKAVSQQDFDDANATFQQADADVASAAASAEAARINLAFTNITAPIGGRVDQSTLTPGALVSANQAEPLTTIRQLDPINIDVTQSTATFLRLQSETTAGRLKLSGQNIPVKLRLESGSEYEHTGKFEFSEVKVDPVTGTFAIRAEFPNPERLLLPGMYVRAVLEAGTAQGFLVPQRAVSHNSKGEAVAKFVDSSGVVEERTLTTRRNLGNDWLVDQGIENGDRLIVEGAQLVHAGQSVSAQVVSIDPATGLISSAGEVMGQAAPQARK